MCFYYESQLRSCYSSLLIKIQICWLKRVLDRRRRSDTCPRRVWTILLKCECCSPCVLARGLGAFPLIGEKRLAGRLVLVCSRREKSSLLVTFILNLRASFSFRLCVRCRRRDPEPSENSWLISTTAAFTSTSIMDRSWASRFRLPGAMAVDMSVEEKKRLDTVVGLANKRVNTSLTLLTVMPVKQRQFQFLCLVQICLVILVTINNVLIYNTS